MREGDLVIALIEVEVKHALFLGNDENEAGIGEKPSVKVARLLGA